MLARSFLLEHLAVGSVPTSFVPGRTSLLLTRIFGLILPKSEQPKKTSAPYAPTFFFEKKR
jgi:hypothetical protein